MSRIGKMPIAVPAGVDVKLEGPHITVKGPKGTLETDIVPGIDVNIAEGVINVTRRNDEKKSRSYHGLTRTIVNNMVTGVTSGFSKSLEVSGVGYRAAKEGNKLVMNLGFSHQVTVEEEDGITIDVPSQNQIIINGIDKQKVGRFAADIRRKRPPEPYKGKGIRYSDEVIRRKEGKTGAK
ncbi:MAG: 50S ribosomal protein L6 [Oscillospiraceae bacterium]|nr:50S ribosomal protein L6 [Oscillospiraceae bacterium]